MFAFIGFFLCLFFFVSAAMNAWGHRESMRPDHGAFWIAASVLGITLGGMIACWTV